MATPEVQNSQNASTMPDGLPKPTMTEGPDVAGGLSDAWWGEFKQVEKVFFILTGVLTIGTVITYLGFWIGPTAITAAGLVIFALALVGIASLSYPLISICVKMFSARRRQRDTECSK